MLFRQSDLASNPIQEANNILNESVYLDELLEPKNEDDLSTILLIAASTSGGVNFAITVLDVCSSIAGFFPLSILYV